MSNPIKFQCPHCQKRYRLAASHQRREVVCQRCSRRFAVDGQPDRDADSSLARQASVFDSLDVEGLLNATSSGLEDRKKKPRPGNDRTPANTLKQNHRQTQADRSAGPTPPNQQPAQSSKRSSRQSARRSARRAKRSSAVKPAALDPSLIESDLDLALARERGKKSDSANDSSAADDPTLNATHRSKEDKSVTPEDDFDDEELAIYRAVTRQNRRRNFLGAALAGLIVVVVGGYFFQSEYARLKVPMTQQQRQWLAQRGFVLKAKPVNDRFVKNRPPMVVVAAGKDFSKVDAFAAPQIEPGRNPPVGLAQAELVRGGLARNGRPGDGFNNFQPQRQAQPLGRATDRPRIHFDTNANANANANPSDQPVSGFLHQLPSRIEVAAADADGGFYFFADGFIKGITAEGMLFEQRTADPALGRVTAMMATPDRRRLVVGSESGRVQSYQLDAEGRLVDEFQLGDVHRHKIIALHATLDSQQLVVHSSDGRMTLWRLDDRELQWNVADVEPQQGAFGMRLTEDSVLIGSAEGIRKLSLNQGSMEVEASDQRYRLLAPNRSGDQFVFADDSRLGVIDAVSKKVMWARSIKISGTPRIEFSPDRDTAFYFDGGRTVLHFEVSSGRILDRLGDPGSGRPTLSNVSQLYVSGDGRRLLVVGNNNRNYLFDVTVTQDVDRSPIGPPLPRPKRQYPPAIDPSTDGLVEVAATSIETAEVAAVCLDDNGYLIAAQRKGRLIVFDWINQQTVDEHFENGKDGVTCLASVGDKVLIGRSSGSIDVATIEPGGKLSSLRAVFGDADAGQPNAGDAMGGAIEFIEIIDQTPLCFAVASGGQTRVWNLETGKTVYNGRPLKQRPVSVTTDQRSNILLADGQRLVTLDYQTGSVKEKTGDRRVDNVRLSPDGKKLAFFDRKRLTVATTRRGDVTTDQPLDQNLNGLMFSPDSKLLFLMDPDRVTVVRVRGGTERFGFPISNQNRMPAELIFSADGEFMTVLSRSAAGKLKVYATPQP